ncbi:MAG: ABC transporter ATP-binding protein/permease, partial [Clostridia bacterium]|nr:ABC transporter ATP-binding protein/permease [Clostridia bacterium]
YDSGSMAINDVSTDKYSDRDWDSYRNHIIGFVFQNYNLIPHQSVLANVELSLTIAGVSLGERRQRAKKALEDVGLGDQMHKRPNQLSGGQMQRVAIARALVNDPDILLADEPTGALDSETGLQVMELLKKVSADHLVIMVTHNADLAKTYATRIVRLKDGRITDDSAPFDPEAEATPPVHKNMGKARMSFLTALSLSFNNLRTKKARTILTAFAGSIGIIGISLILSLSNGVNNYIIDLQRTTMVSYPITLEAQSIDLNLIMSANESMRPGDKPLHDDGRVHTNSAVLSMASQATDTIVENNLTAFKRYLDDETSPIHKHLGENGIVYSYDTRFTVYAYDPMGAPVNVQDNTQSGEGIFGMAYMRARSNMMSRLLPGQNGELVSRAVTENYELVSGSWPSAYDEIVLVTDVNDEISYMRLSQMGFLPAEEYNSVMTRLYEGESVALEDYSFSYEELMAQRFYLIPACDLYEENENGTYSSIAGDPIKLYKHISGAIELKISGIIRPKADADYTNIMTPLAYTQALTEYLIEYTDRAPVVLAQRAQPEVNILTGLSFAAQSDEDKAANARAYITNMGPAEKEELGKRLVESFSSLYPVDMDTMMNFGSNGYSAMMDMLLNSDSPQTDRLLVMIFDMTLSGGSFEDNLTAFGVISLDSPTSISLYADTFEAKDAISACIDAYNETVPESDRAVYTDYVGLLMSSVTTIVDVISYVLIAFVAVSLVVSSIMIGVITYISVLERTKEIGILRALGASKHNVSQVFNAETFIIGALAGAMGVGVSALLLVPINAIIHSLADTDMVSASLPIGGALTLVAISIVLTVISGLIPSKKAARRDPVTALRTE